MSPSGCLPSLVICKVTAASVCSDTTYIAVAVSYTHLDVYKRQGLGVAAGLHKDDLDGVVLLHILEGVGLHRAHVLAVDQHLGAGVALIRGCLLYTSRCV